MLAHYGGVAQDISWPGTFDKFVNLHVYGIQYTMTRLVILGFGLVIGGALWFWLQKTRSGMVIRAGVDDRDMVSAMGINIQLTFAIAFVVGSALAGFGGVIGGSFASLAPGVDANWLLNSLVVVIIGGMGSLGGAAIGSLLLGLTTNFAAAYLPANYTYYSIIFTFVLLAIVLAVRPLGLFGRPRMSSSAGSRLSADRIAGGIFVVLALFAPLIFTEYWVATLLTQMLFLGVVAASLIFLSAYGGMVSLAQVSLYGVAGFVLGNLTTNGNTKGLNLGWAEAPGIVVALVIAVFVAFVFGALASRSYGIYFLMITLVLSVIANLFFGQVTSVSGFGGISGIPIPDFLSRTAHPDRLYFVTLAVALIVYALLRYVARTPFGLTLQGIRDDPVRMSSLGYNVTLHRALAFTFAGFMAVGGVVFVWWNARSRRPRSTSAPRSICW